MERRKAHLNNLHTLRIEDESTRECRKWIDDICFCFFTKFGIDLDGVIIEMMELHLRIPQLLRDIISSLDDVYRGVLSVELIGHKRHILTSTEDEEADFSPCCSYLKMKYWSQWFFDARIFEGIVEDIEYLRRYKYAFFVHSIDLDFEEDEMILVFL